MTPDEHIQLLHAAGQSATFYERVRVIREAMDLAAAGRLRDFQREREIVDLPAVERQFQMAGERLHELWQAHSDESEVVGAVVGHDARAAALLF
jgi:hypothetical protein